MAVRLLQKCVSTQSLTDNEWNESNTCLYGAGQFIPVMCENKNDAKTYEQGAKNAKNQQ